MAAVGMVHALTCRHLYAQPIGFVPFLLTCARGRVHLVSSRGTDAVEHTGNAGAQSSGGTAWDGNRQRPAYKRAGCQQLDGERQ